MQKRFSIAEAKDKLPRIVHDVEKGPSVEFTRRGKPVAVLLSIREYEKLSCKSKGFWDSLSRFRETMNDDGIEIDDNIFAGLRDHEIGRKIDLTES